MTTLAEKIVAILSERPGMSDRELASKLLGPSKPQQAVNIQCRLLKDKGILKRQKREDSILGNYLTEQSAPVIIVAKQPSSIDVHTEDAVKKHLVTWLTKTGWKSDVKWGRDRGIDIDAHRQNERWIIEVKGIGSYQPMRVNYFLSALAETLQRMNDPNAFYSVAFPDVAQYRGLWNRLPLLAKKRTTISALFITENGDVTHVD